jgi:hypothetical protein
VALKDKKAETVRETVLRMWISYFGNPVLVLHDRATELVGNVLNAEFRSRGILSRGTNSHASNGGSEAQVKILKAALTLELKNHCDFAEIVKRLPGLQLKHNGNVDSYGMSPMMMVMGIQPGQPGTPPAADGGSSDDVFRTARLVEMQTQVITEVSRRVEMRRETVKRAIALKEARPFLAGESAFLLLPTDRQAASRKLSHKSAGPYTVMGPGPSPNTVRVLMNRGNLTEGNVVHVSYLKHFDACEARYWYDPVPNVASSFAGAEDGAWPGNLGLTPSQLEELSEELGGSNPLVPSVLPRSENCLVCRQKQLLKAGAMARVDCAFCNAFVHSTCLYNAGTARVAEKKPDAYRCAHCVLELEKAFRFVEKKQLEQKQTLSGLWSSYDGRMRFLAGGAAE